MRSQPQPPAASPMMLLNLLGTWGPAVAALLLTGILGGKGAVAALLGRLREWRVGAAWYAVALLGWPLLLAVALLLERLLVRTRTDNEQLSARELDVLALVARGNSNKQIAAALHISQATVKTHLVHIFGKLGVDDRTSAVTRALERGLIRLSA